MNSGLVRIRRRPKYRIAFEGRQKRVRFRFYIGILSLLAGLGITIFSLIKHYF